MTQQNSGRCNQLDQTWFWVIVLFAIIPLCGCGSNSVGKLVAQLDDPDPEQRCDAAKALADYGAEAKPAVDKLAVLLSDSDAQVRYRAAKALSKIGPDAKSAVNQLGAALSDSDPQVRYFAAKTLDDVADSAEQQVALALTGVLKDRNPKTRYFAAKALGKMGNQAQSALNQLESLTYDADKTVQQAAKSAIRRIKKSRS